MHSKTNRMLNENKEGKSHAHEPASKRRHIGHNSFMIVCFILLSFFISTSFAAAAEIQGLSSSFNTDDWQKNENTYTAATAGRMTKLTVKLPPKGDFSLTYTVKLLEVSGNDDAFNRAHYGWMMQFDNKRKISAYSWRNRFCLLEERDGKDIFHNQFGGDFSEIVEFGPQAKAHTYEILWRENDESEFLVDGKIMGTYSFGKERPKDLVFYFYNCRGEVSSIGWQSLKAADSVKAADISGKEKPLAQGVSKVFEAKDWRKTDNTYTATTAARMTKLAVKLPPDGDFSLTYTLKLLEVSGNDDAFNRAHYGWMMQFDNKRKVQVYSWRNRLALLEEQDNKNILHNQLGGDFSGIVEFGPQAKAHTYEILWRENGESEFLVDGAKMGVYKLGKDRPKDLVFYFFNCRGEISSIGWQPLKDAEIVK